MAAMHPITFIARRILYAVVIVYIQGENLTYFGSAAMLLTCLVMLSIVTLERQFIEKMINW